MSDDETSRRAPSWSFFGGRVADAIADVPDVRDQLYQPSLIPLPPHILPFRNNPPSSWWSPNRIRDQGTNRSCVGHALAAVIDHMRAVALGNDPTPATRRTLDGPFVSAEMLYSMAQFHDEWAGEGYFGSSIRGGLKGFFYNGVCSQAQAKQRSDAPVENMTQQEASTWYMTKILVEEARTIQLGAYYRIRPRLPDMHAALVEANAIIVSASLHPGWERPNTTESTIEFSARQRRGDEQRSGLHAFAVIGYDDVGFWIQNSWGPAWGCKGLARWCYEDWAANAVDAWVLRLAILPPNPLVSVRRPSRLTATGSKIERSETHFLGQRPTDASGPSRLDILGHLIPFRDGRLDRRGPYNVNQQTLSETFRLIKSRYADDKAPAYGGSFADRDVVIEPEDRKYHHVLIYFLGGWPDENRLASDVADVIPLLTERGIYPFFVSFDTPMFRELNFVIRRAIDEVAQMTRNTPSARRLVRDRLVEGRIAVPGNRILRDLRLGARRVFRADQSDPDYVFPDLQPYGEGAYYLARLFEDLAPMYRNQSLDFHVAAHGFGAQMLIECLACQDVMHAHASFSTCTLISPLVASHRIGHKTGAVQTDSLFDALMRRGERVRRHRSSDRIFIERLRLITLSEQSLMMDRFSDDYSQSWPLMWSYVMGLDPAAFEAGKTVESEVPLEAARQRYCHVPLLGLAAEARDFVDAAKRDGLDVSALQVVEEEDEADSSLHHELGFHRQVLEAIASDITGDGGVREALRGKGRRIRLV